MAATLGRAARELFEARGFEDVRIEEIAAAALYLADAAWVTGEVLDINGGAHTMRYPDLNKHVLAAFGGCKLQAACPETTIAAFGGGKTTPSHVTRPPPAAAVNPAPQKAYAIEF